MLVKSKGLIQKTVPLSLLTTDPTRISLGSNPKLRNARITTNRMGHNVAHQFYFDRGFRNIPKFREVSCPLGLGVDLPPS